MFNAEMYFPHRMGARKDPKILCLRAEIGANATAPYWDLVEILYEIQDHKIEFEFLVGYANDLDYELEYLQKVIQSCIKFKLFSADETHFWSESVFKRIAKINGTLNDLAEKQARNGRLSAAKRYGYAVDENGYKISNDPVTKSNDPVTVVKPNLTTYNLTKETKTKETKEKINKKEIEKFPNEFETFQNVIVFYEAEKRSAETEFGIFVRKHKDWKNVIPLLENAIKQQSEVWNQKNTEPQYRKKFGNWLAERSWELYKAEPIKVTKTWAEIDAEQKREREEQRQKDYLMWQQAQQMSANVN